MNALFCIFVFHLAIDPEHFPMLIPVLQHHSNIIIHCAPLHGCTMVYSIPSLGT